MSELSPVEEVFPGTVELSHEPAPHFVEGGHFIFLYFDPIQEFDYAFR